VAKDESHWFLSPNKLNFHWFFSPNKRASLTFIGSCRQTNRQDLLPSLVLVAKQSGKLGF